MCGGVVDRHVREVADVDHRVTADCVVACVVDETAVGVSKRRREHEMVLLEVGKRSQRLVHAAAGSHRANVHRDVTAPESNVEGVQRSVLDVEAAGPTWRASMGPFRDPCEPPRWMAYEGPTLTGNRSEDRWTRLDRRPSPTAVTGPLRPGNSHGEHQSPSRNRTRAHVQRMDPLIPVFFAGWFLLVCVLGPFVAAEDRPAFRWPDRKPRRMV